MMSDVRFDPSELRATANVYALLGQLWLKEVDESLFAKLQTEPLRSQFQFPPDIFQETSVDQLAADYCRLFVGPRGHFPPVQSVWVKGQLDSEIASSVRFFAEAISYVPSDAYPNVLTDHLGVELEIMSVIHNILADQMDIGSNGDARAMESRAFAATFFLRHLTWTDRLVSAAIASCEETAIYRSLLETTRDFLSVEAVEWTSQ